VDGIALRYSSPKPQLGKERLNPITPPKNTKVRKTTHG